ncbi:MAG: SDR family oxidoreductase [Proteobacteria bacterium]|nr:SDR family oxidoreductase [Pseudomonadota bacterium]
MGERFLEGRTALITGGATGMGRAIAEALSGAGANIAIGSLASGAELKGGAYAHLPSQGEVGEAVAAIAARGGQVKAFPLDLRDEATVETFHKATVAAFGPVDILVNAAGVSAQALVTDENSDDVWATVLDINLNGSYRTIRRCMPAMIERGWGRIVNIASTAANVGFPRNGAYCASKHGLLGLTRCVALEGAPHGVTCNAINPGSVGTGMMRRGSEIRASRGEGGSWEENFELVAQGMPQRRLITVEEIAATALFLCRDEARGITSEDIDVAGGALW